MKIKGREINGFWRKLVIALAGGVIVVVVAYIQSATERAFSESAKAALRSEETAGKVNEMRTDIEVIKTRQEYIGECQEDFAGDMKEQRTDIKDIKMMLIRMENP